MKFIHMADMHLGAVVDAGRPWSDTRSKELWDTFTDICDACDREKADLLLIAGDLFDRTPLKKELERVAYLLGKLNRAQVVWMAGDSDHLRKKDIYTSFAWPENVHFLSGERMDEAYFPFLDTSVVGMSYMSEEITDAIYDDLSPEINDTYHILLAHGGDEKHVPIDLRKLATAGFDYVALGHLHAPRILEREKCAYAGSPEPLEPDEMASHGVILGEITSAGTRLKFIPMARRQYKKVTLYVGDGSDTKMLLDKLRSVLAAEGMQHIYTVELTGSSSRTSEIDVEELYTAGNILEIVDCTHSDYNLDRIKDEHSGDIIGRFISEMQGYPEDDETAKKALDYGVTALLGGLR